MKSDRSPEKRKLQGNLLNTHGAQVGASFELEADIWYLLWKKERNKNSEKVTIQILLVTNYQINWIRREWTVEKKHESLTTHKKSCWDIGEKVGKMEKLLTHHIQFKW